MLALGPAPELGFALAIAALGTIVGQGVAAYRASRDPTTNTHRIVFAWTALFLAAGSAFALLYPLFA